MKSSLFDRSLLKESFDSWDFRLGALAGEGAAVFLAFSPASHADASPFLYALAALNGGLIALSLTVLALLFAFTDREYHRLVEAADPHGFKGALRPFVIVAVVAAIGTATAFGTVLTWSFDSIGVQRVLLSTSTGLAAWALVGVVELVGLLIWHADQKSKWFGVYDDVERQLKEQQDHGQ